MFSRSLGGSFGEGSAIAETLEPANGLAGDVGALALVEVIGAEVLEDDAIVEQVIDNGEEAMGDCEQGPLPAAAGGQSVVLDLEVAVLLARGAPGAFDQDGAQPAVALARVSGASPAGRLVVARDDLAPGGQATAR